MEGPSESEGDLGITFFVPGELGAERIRAMAQKYLTDSYPSPQVMEETRQKYYQEAKACVEQYLAKNPYEDFEAIVIEKEPEEDDHDELTVKSGGLHTWIARDRPIEQYLRQSRRLAANNFRWHYNFLQGNKICVSSEKTCRWSGMCYDSTWIAVHGMQSICMVTRRRDVDMTRVGGYYQRYCTNQQTMCSYAEAVISEVESLPFDDDDDNTREYDVREMFGQSIEKPFSVVSVVSDTKKVSEESGPNEASSADDYDEVKASAFLKKKMNSGLAFTTDETIQAAISGFQHLCPRVLLKAEDIWVTTLRIPENWYEHMHIDQRKEHLAVISGGSSSGGKLGI